MQRIHESVQQTLCVGKYALGPIWYHGTSRKAAESIMRQGFRHPTVSDACLGKGTYFSARALAIYFGQVLIATEIHCDIYDWDLDECAAIRRKVHFPSSRQAIIMLSAKSDRLPVRLAEAMLANGIKAVRYFDPAGFVEVCVYDKKVIELRGIYELDEPVPGEQAAPLFEADSVEDAGRRTPSMRRLGRGTFFTPGTRVR